MTKILLVEDDKSLREIYGVRLLAEGYDIVSAGDGEEALAMAIKDRPELIVSDVMMPKISGFDMLDILRSTTETRDIKVIMMTALSSEDQRQRGEKLGADRYLVKSQVGIEDVVRTVHEVLEDVPAAPSQQVDAPLEQPAAAPFQQPTEPVAAEPTAQPAQAPAPAAQQAPAAAPQPEQAPAQPAATEQPQPAPDSSFPQPTAPFSSPRPATLGERIIQPIDSEPTPPQGDIADRIAAELSQQQPAAQQAPAAAPQPEQAPAQPAAQPQTSSPETQGPRGAQPYNPESN